MRKTNTSREGEQSKGQGIAALLVPGSQRLQAGRMYLKLLHGRNSLHENLDNWGFNGPIFGPLD